MVTVAHVVKQRIRERPFLQEAIARGIVNHAALAEELRGIVARELGKEVKFSAVNMAIRRLAESLEQSRMMTASFAGSDLTVQSDLLAMTVKRDVHLPLEKLQALIDYERGDVLTVTQGLHEAMVICNRRYETEVRRLIPSGIKTIISNISAVTIRLPAESVEQVGHFFLATRALAWENIPLVDIVSTYTEMTLLVREQETTRAYNALRRMLERSG